MMYEDKFVVAIKVDGRVLREDGDTVLLPFGCEYSILLKNLNSVRAQMTVSVDGVDASNGKLVVDPNSSMELERFIRNGNLQSGNRFKFIERTAEIEAHRGVGVDDGLIRVEAWREHVQRFVDVPIPRYREYPVPPPYPNRPRYPQTNYKIPSKRASLRGGPSGMAGRPLTPPRPSMQASLGRSAVGITVPGRESRQQFRNVPDFRLEPQSVVIVLRLRGSVDGMEVPFPVTVDMKPFCVTCGNMNASATAQFCDRCGTAMHLI